MGGPGPAGVLQLQELFLRILTIFVGLSFMTITVVLIYAGITYLTSGGDQAKIKTAGQAVTWALLGGLYLALSWVILKLLGAFTGIDLTHFCLGFPGVLTACPL